MRTAPRLTLAALLLAASSAPALPLRAQTTPTADDLIALVADERLPGGDRPLRPVEAQWTLWNARPDPEFLAEATKMQIDIVPASGSEVEAFIARVAASSPAVVERARRAIRND